MEQVTPAERQESNKKTNNDWLFSRRLGSFVLSSLIRLFMRTYRITVLPAVLNPSKDLNQGKAPPLHFLSSWHEHIWTFVGVHRGIPYRALASRSGGGRFIGEVCKNLGYSVVYGSSTKNGRDKGGARAVMRLLRSVKEQFCVSITVDGSVGPRRQAKPGVIELSKRTGVPIVAFSYWCSKSWRLPTWDKMEIPKPFSRVVVRYSDPLYVPKDVKDESQIDEYTKRLTELMHENELKAQRFGLESLGQHDEQSALKRF